MHYDSDKDFENWLSTLEADERLDEIDKQRLAEEHRVSKLNYFCIYHQYDMGDQHIFVSKQNTSKEDIERVIAYCCFMCEEFFGDEKSLTNFGLANLLISYYGYDYSVQKISYRPINAYYARERACPSAKQIMEDETLHRAGMKEMMLPHVF